MAMMAKMRSLAPAFIISVGVIFVLFMVLSDSSVMEIFGARSNVVGSVDGVKITYQEFMKALDTERENQKQQTGKDMPDEQSDQFRDQVWDALVTKTLLDKQIKKFGISVSNQEIRDIILSNNPPEFLKRNFVDSTGKFNKQMYMAAIYDPRNSQALIQAEDYIRQNQLNQKLQSMLLASITVSNAEIKRKFIEQNTKINAQYTLVSLSEFPESTINITNEDLKNYYNQHLDQFQIQAQRKLKYVLFPTSPSSDDTANVRRDMESVLTQVQNDTASFKSMVETYSNAPYAKDTISITSLSPDAGKLLSNAKPGTIVGPVITSQGYAIYHLIGVVPTKDTFVRASHILINQFGDDKKNYDEAMTLYNELQKGADFSTLAKQYSKDPGSAVRGGDLGWFGKGQMVPEFEKASFEGKVGVVQKPIKTNYGYHIIKVTGRTSDKFVVEKIVEPIQASASTKDQQLSNAKDFSYIAKKDGFDKEAKLMKYKVIETPNFGKEYNYVPGLGVNKNLVDFAFENDVNSISDAIKVANGYVIVQVSGKTSEGVKSFDDVKNIIRPQVVREKQFEKAEQQAQMLKSKIGGDLTKSTSIDPKAVVSQTGEFTADQSIPEIGMDYNFAAQALKLPLNKISDPVKGLKGYYLINVLSRTPFDASAFAVQKNTILNSILQQKKNVFFSEWLAKLKKDADIVDHRNQFFGQ